jgi:hypothetical protein
LYVGGMGGFGDSVYQRPLILNQLDLYDEVYLRTPLPELYRDTPIKCVPWPDIALRCQIDSVERWGGTWHEPPDVKMRVVRYHLADRRKNIVTDLETSFRPDGRYEMTLPSFADEAPKFDKPYAVVRPCTVRKEWQVPTRNAKPEYIAEAAVMLADMGYHVVTVAHCEDGLEWIEEPAPWSHTAYLRGELTTGELMGLIEGASIVVGSPGFMLPTALAYGTPMVCVLGGQLRFNAPHVLTDPRMDTSRLGWIWPDNPCHCNARIHPCRKEVTGFESRFREEVANVLEQRAAA